MPLETSRELRGNLGNAAQLDGGLTEGQALQASLSSGSGLRGTLSTGRRLVGVLENLVPEIHPIIGATPLVALGAFGTLAAANVSPQSFAIDDLQSASAFGSPTVASVTAQMLELTELSGAAAFGSITIANLAAQSFTLYGLASPADFGSLTVADQQLSITLTGLAGSSGIGDHNIATIKQSLDLTALTSSANFGSPSLANSAAQALDLAGIASSAAIGEPVVTDLEPAVTLTGLAAASVVGNPTIANTSAQNLDLAALAGASAFGSSTLANVAAQPLSFTGLASSAAIGEPVVTDFEPALTLTGLAAASVVGNPTIANTSQAFELSGLASNAAFGSPTIVTVLQTLDLTGLTSGAAIGSLTIAVAVDTDLAAYLTRVSNNSGTLSAAEETAMSNLISGLKDGGYWAGCTHLFCFIGTDYNAAKTWVKGGQDGTSGGSVNIFDGTHYTRETGFYREGSSVYNCEFNLGSNSTFNWGGSDPITTYWWGRNSRNGARQGLHPASASADQWSLPSYHEGAYGGGWQIKARKATGATQENGWGGSSLDTASFQAMAYDGSTGFACRSMNQSDTKSGASLTLSSTISSVNSAFEITVDNPVLGVALWDGVEHTNAQMDAINELFHDFATDCGITMGAYNPDTD